MEFIFCGERFLNAVIGLIKVSPNELVSQFRAIFSDDAADANLMGSFHVLPEILLMLQILVQALFSQVFSNHILSFYILASVVHSAVLAIGHTLIIFELLITIRAAPGYDSRLKD